MERDRVREGREKKKDRIIHLRELCKRKQKLLAVLCMGKPQYRQTTVPHSAAELAMEADLDLLTSSSATWMRAGPPPSPKKMEHSSLTKTRV